MKLICMLLCMCFAALSAVALEPIPLDLFRDGIHHYRMNRTAGYRAYNPGQVREIADNLLLYQRDNGGWPSNFDPTAILNEEQRRELENLKTDTRATTFDNRATYPAVEYLAAAHAQTGNTAYRDAALRGIEFMLEAQYENGGWPHSCPRKDGYRPRITIVDDVMTGMLHTLRKIEQGNATFDFLTPELRQRVATARERGDACLLALQIRVDGQPTGWAAQYDELTLEPAMGRSFELPALISSESVGVLRYLMSIEDPSEEIISAVEAGCAWLDRSRIEGLRIERVPAPRVQFEHHISEHDVVEVEDPTAPPIWARFYEIDTNRPFMANRDGKKVFRLADVTRERRTGYGWYSNSPQKLLEKDLPAWRQKWETK